MAIKSPTYLLARDCGHWTRYSRHACYGIEWCETCREYRGVIVTRVAPPTPKVYDEASPTIGTAA